MSGGDDVPSSSLVLAGLGIFDMGLKINQNQARFILEYTMELEESRSIINFGSQDFSIIFRTCFHFYI